MPIQAFCPSCRTSYTLAESIRNKKVRCKKCECIFIASEAVGSDLSQETALEPIPLEDNLHRFDGDRPQRNRLVPWLLGGVGALVFMALGVAGTLLAVNLNDRRPATGEGTPPEQSSQAKQSVILDDYASDAKLSPLPSDSSYKRFGFTYQL